MTWGSFTVKTLGLLVLLWVLLFYGYGNYVLADNIVPVEGIEIEEWLSAYNITGLTSGIVAFACSALWFYFGDNYTGGSGIRIKYYGLMIVDFIIAVVLAVVLLPRAIDGSGMSSTLVVLNALLVFYLSSIIASAGPVKYIPALAEVFHK